MEPGLDVNRGADECDMEGHGSTSWSSPQREPTDYENSSSGQSATALAKPGRGARSAGWCGPRTPEALCNAEEPPETGAADVGGQNGNSSGSHHGDSSANRKSDRSKKDRQISMHDDHGELDYDEDEDAVGDGGELGDHSNYKEDNPDNVEDSGIPSLLEKEDSHPPLINEGSSKAKGDKEVKDGEKSDEGEIQDEDCEDGEIKDDEKRPFVRSQICRFFKRGHCTWGYNCRFLHPGVNDKGAYSLVDRPGLTAFSKPVTAEAMELVNVPPAVPPYISAAPKAETAWERGLRQAKEAMRRACRKKETETDLEYKKLSISLADAENKENDKKYKDPYYDNVDDVDNTLVLDQSKRTSDAKLEQPRKNQWQVGNYENFEIRSSRDSYDNRNDLRVKDPVPPPARYSLPKPPAQYETRGIEGPISPHLPRRERPSPAAPPQDNLKSGDSRGRDNGVQPPFGNRADDWHDPWQRSRESRARRRSLTPDRRRHASRGSDSGSSGSSYSRSKSASYSSSYSDGDSSRSSSASSASSRSSSKSRSRVPSTRRAPPLADRTTARTTQHSHKPALQQPLPPAVPQQSSSSAVAAAGSSRAQRGPRDDKPPPEPRRGRDEWQAPAGRGMPPPAPGTMLPPAARDGRSAPRRPESPLLGTPKYQPFLISSTPNVRVPGRPGNDGLQKEHHPASGPPSRTALLGKGPARHRRSGSSGSDSSRSVSPPRSPAGRQRGVPGGGDMSAYQRSSTAAAAVAVPPRAFGGARADNFTMSPIRDRSTSPHLSASPRRTDRGQRYRSRSPSGDDVYGDLDRVPYAPPAATVSATGGRDGRAGASLSRTNSKDAPRRPDDGQFAPLPRDAPGGGPRQKVGPPLPGAALPAQPSKARPTGEAPRAAADTPPMTAGSRPAPRASAAASGLPAPEQQQPAARVIGAPGGPGQKPAIKLTLISKPQPINLGARKRSAINEGSLSPPPAAAPPPSKRPTLPFAPSEALASDKTGAPMDKVVVRTTAKQGAVAAESGSAAARPPKLAGAPLVTATSQPRPGGAAVAGGGSIAPAQLSMAAAATAAIASAGVAGSGLSKAAATKKTTSSRREELLKQLKAVEDAIARKRSKV